MNQAKNLELEIAMKKACIEDLLVAINVHNQRGEYALAADCGRKIKNTAHAIVQMQTQLRDNRNFGYVLQNYRGKCKCAK
ncbi:hypothetical protein [Lysinibacillus piscis]|uniref:Aspartyl-phosphate phosphatase Spo0E family protein n=1 Tax=Lysinibacillus piscis TaxID=2518931 RepID=A0ABQ5NIN3_9BACI|nr:hypothetical protein [Lysinibacillus sp. KH24]GLC88231.1 hypothetical protein LYSBPC_13580 [Lysinibacillus sp. KH24]